MLDAHKERLHLFALDGIVMLVDAKHVHLHLEDSSECKEQIAFADVLVLNKCDLVTPAELDALERRVTSMNAMARVLRATNANVPISSVLDLGGFDLERALTTKPTFLEREYPFEWAGTYLLEEGEYALTLDEGPDPSVDLVLSALASDEAAHAESAAERAVRLWSEEVRIRSPRQVVEAIVRAPYRLDVSASGEKTFFLRVPQRARVGLYTQHLPSEFNLRLTRGDVPALPITEGEFAAGHTHDSEVGSVGIHLEGAVDENKLNKWLSQLLREKGTDIFRMKGIIDVAGSANRFVFQGVHMLLGR